MKKQKTVAAGLAAVAVVGAGGAKLISRGGDNVAGEAGVIGRNVDGLGGVHPPEVPVSGVAPALTPAQQNQRAREIALGSICQVVTDLYAESQGEITRDEVIEGVASQTSEAVTGVPINIVADATDSLLAAQNIYGDLGPRVALKYVEVCSPVRY